MFKYFGSPKLESFTSLTSKAESGVNYNACFAHVVTLVLLQPLSQGIVFFLTQLIHLSSIWRHLIKLVLDLKKLTKALTQSTGYSQKRKVYFHPLLADILFFFLLFSVAQSSNEQLNLGWPSGNLSCCKHFRLQDNKKGALNIICQTRDQIFALARDKKNLLTRGESLSDRSAHCTVRKEVRISIGSRIYGHIIYMYTNNTKLPQYWINWQKKVPAFS